MILIAGKAEAGKSTLAHMIAAEAFKCGMVPAVMSFAGALKKEAASKGYDKESNPEKYREYCQTYGALYRKDNPEHWVDKLDDEVRDLVKKERASLKNNNKYWERCIIIDDCRYINEVAYGKDNEAILIFLTAGNRKLKEAEWRAHESEELAHLVEEGTETGELFNHIIFNDSSEKALQKKIKAMVPVWCGITACKDIKNRLCDCTACVARRAGEFTDLEDIVTELMDLLDLEEEDLDEET